MSEKPHAVAILDQSALLALVRHHARTSPCGVETEIEFFAFTASLSLQLRAAITGDQCPYAYVAGLLMQAAYILSLNPTQEITTELVAGFQLDLATFTRGEPAGRPS